MRNQKRKGQKEQPAGNGRSHTRSSAAHTGQSQLSKDKKVVHEAVDRHGKKKKPHGELRIPHGIDKRAQDTGSK